VGLGDSEMAGQGRKPYCKLIADRNKMTFYNHGVGGQHITETASDDNLSLIENDAYYVIVQIGYNDPQNPSYLDDATSDDSTDTTTFKGAFNHIVDYIQTNRPSARLGIVLPRYYEDDSTPQNHEWHYATSMWMAKRARILHIPFFDETANSGMSYSVAAQRQLYFGDYVHLTNEGMERISYPIEQWLRGL
jgi:lysophospholipase L1-like esterase